MGFHPVDKVTVERLFHPERVIRVEIIDPERGEPEVLTFGHDDEDQVALCVTKALKRKSM